MMRMIPFVVALSACTQFPELDGLVSPDTKDVRYPRLVPIGPLVTAGDALGGTRRDDIKDPLLARLAALDSRAAFLRGDVIDRRTRRRLAKGVTLPDYATDP